MKKYLNSKIHEINDKAEINTELKQKVLYGVEIEMEGRLRLEDFSLKQWVVTQDGSLRGDSAREFVLATPASKKEACNSVKGLYGFLKNKNSVISNSMRAGVHIHMNVNHLTFKQFMTFITAYYCFEDVITNMFGPDRVGNLFCLRLCDASAVINTLNAIIASPRDMRVLLRTDAIRYAALNLSAVPKYGSVEFRAMQTPTTAEPIINWIELLDKLLEESLKFSSPFEVINMFSADGIDNMINRFFSESNRKAIVEQGNYAELIEDCYRNIQFIVYTNKWED